MITEISGSILSPLPNKSIVLNQCNLRGQLGNGIGGALRRKYPEMADELYHNCGWFANGHEDEIIGSFLAYRASEGLIICNTMTQVPIAKNKESTDYDALARSLKKIEKQMCRKLTKENDEWTLCVPDKFASAGSPESYERVHQMFEDIFADSPVKVAFYKY